VITIWPPTFTKVEYEASQLAELVRGASALVPALPPDLDVEVRVDEEQATTRATVMSMEPLVFAVDSGALENLKDPRRCGELESTVTFVRLFLEVVDRRSESFGAPELGMPTTQAHKISWEVNLFGRASRLGLRLHSPRFRYDFRNRHGFSDNADQIFDVLWASDDLSFARIVELSARATDTLGVEVPATPV
jgi:hypothetical protein